MSAASPPQALNRLSSHEPGLGEVCRARHIVATLGGRFSLELGIDVDLDEREIDRWALGATLVGDPSPVAVGIRTYRVLESAGIRTLEDVRGCDRAELKRFLREGGYAPHVSSTRSRLLGLADDGENVRSRPSTASNSSTSELHRWEPRDAPELQESRNPISGPPDEWTAARGESPGHNGRQA